METAETILQQVTVAAADCLDGIAAAGPRLVRAIVELDDATAGGCMLPAWFTDSADDIAAALVDCPDGLEFRVYIRPGGKLELSTGCGQYDTDHTGVCGCGFAAADDTAGDIAESLVEAMGEAIDDILAGCG